jgi:hypothetical protein
MEGFSVQTNLSNADWRAYTRTWTVKVSTRSSDRAARIGGLLVGVLLEAGAASAVWSDRNQSAPSQSGVGLDRPHRWLQMKKRVKREPIPSKSDWAGFESDLDVRYFHGLVFGKSNAEIQSFFENGRSIERSSELLFAPVAVFQYYVQGFAAYLMSIEAKGDSDAANSFLRLLEAREMRHPGSVKPIYAALADCIEFIGAHQELHRACGVGHDHTPSSCRRNLVRSSSDPRAVT